METTITGPAHDSAPRRRIINTYDQQVADGGDRVVIYYTAQDLGRGGHGAYWSVGHFVGGRAKVTDPSEYLKQKQFGVYGQMGRGMTHHQAKLAALEEAKAWAFARYGARDLVRNRMGDMVEREVNEKHPLPKRDRG